MSLSIKSRDTEQPTMEAFAEAPLEGLSDAKVLEFYQDAFPTNRKTARSHRLGERQLILLQRLEAAGALQPQTSDLETSWLDDLTADKLTIAGINFLGAL